MNKDCFVARRIVVQIAEFHIDGGDAAMISFLSFRRNVFIGNMALPMKET